MNHLFQLKSLSAILLIVMCSYSANGYAETQGKKKTKETQQQKVKEDYGNTVKLVTSGSGSNEDEATRNALRNALEQAYGTFVSSNTTVINDELVGDVISSISSGNVLGYEIISSINTPKGDYQVTIQSIVSIGELVSYATSHGMSTELAGNTFLLNRKLAKLNKENEKNAMQNLIGQLTTILGKGIFDFTIEVGQPKGNDPYYVEVVVKAMPNENYNIFWDTIDKTLSSLSMSSSESENYKTLGMPTYEYSYGPEFYGFKIDNQSNLIGTKSKYRLRNNIGKNGYGRVSSDEKTEVLLMQTIANAEKLGLYCFEVYDNIGTVLTPTLKVSSKNVTNKIDGVCYGVIGKTTCYDIKLLNTSSSGDNRLVKDANFSADGEKLYGSFKMIYNENRLSKLSNISIRPHSLFAH